MTDRAGPPQPTLRAEADALVGAIQRAPRSHLLADGEIRAAVRRYASAARAAGVPPERLIVQLKDLVRRDAAPDLGNWYRAVLTDRVVVWAIEGYYGIPDAES